MRSVVLKSRKRNFRARITRGRSHYHHETSTSRTIGCKAERMPLRCRKSKRQSETHCTTAERDERPNDGCKDDAMTIGAFKTALHIKQFRYFVTVIRTA